MKKFLCAIIIALLFLLCGCFKIQLFPNDNQVPRESGIVESTPEPTPTIGNYEQKNQTEKQNSQNKTDYPLLNEVDSAKYDLETVKYGRLTADITVHWALSEYQFDDMTIYVEKKDDKSTNVALFVEENFPHQIDETLLKIIEEFNEQNDSSTIVNSGLYEWDGKQVIFMENIDDYEASGSYGTICLYAKIGEEKIATLVGAYNNKDDRDEVLDVMKILERSVNMS